jgi:hypothetical protein
MSHLETLARHRDAILLIEAIGWLHDYRKCSDEQLRTQAANLSSQQGLPRKEIAKRFPSLTTSNVHLLGESCPLLDLLDHSTSGTCTVLPDYLSRCHNTAHFDKQESHGGKQNYPGAQLSSPFGFEYDVPFNLTDQLWGSIPWTTIPGYTASNHFGLNQAASQLFSRMGADTRRPINEISLWDWGVLVGALYKAAIAGALLGHQPTAHDLRWRLLGVRLDGLPYVLEALRMPDLLARQALVTDGLNRVRALLEVTYPTGSEVYRDEAGALFVVPDLPNLLDDFTNQHGQSLRPLILQEFAQGTLENNHYLQVGEEIVPEVYLDGTAWWGQDPDWQTKQQSGQPPQNEIPPVGKLLSAAIASYPQAEAVQAFWKHQSAEICTVCGLRPQGPGQKAQERNVCDICEKRRADRSLKWATEQTGDTIWIDEVGDINGRVALITGQFELSYWLDGRLVESLVLIAPNSTASSPSIVETKSASFSRIRRIWEAMRRFWQEVRQVFSNLLSDNRRRIQLWLDQKPDLGDFHVYELDLGRATLSLVWYPPDQDGTGGYFISADNLGCIARQLGAEKEIYEDPAAGAIFVEDYIQEQFVDGKQKPILRNPEARGTKQENLIAGRSITRLQHQDAAYSTAISILAEPRTFMALAPADKALAVVQAIKEKYEREMGKVRNRLSLHLGVVYAHRRTPLRAVLDAGRRMLQFLTPASLSPSLGRGAGGEGGDETWTVQKDAIQGVLPPEKQALATGTQQFRQTITVKLKQNGRFLTWYVPTVMGDGNTRDEWYPYVFIETHGDDSQVSGRTLAFKGLRPTANGTEVCWLVHAAELKQGDEAYFTPATFDFEWLDSTARRFEIAYDIQGKRHGRLTRPYLLDDLGAIQQVWQWIGGQDGLTTSQIHALRAIIETRREAWQIDPNDQTFRQLCRQAIRNAGWRKQPPDTDREKLTDWAANGLLADVVELYLGIMKEKPQRSQTSQE